MLPSPNLMTLSRAMVRAGLMGFSPACQLSSTAAEVILFLVSGQAHLILRRESGGEGKLLTKLQSTPA
jgi:hypothetical protein